MPHTPQELIEELAAIEHERWADWQKYCHSKMSQLSCSPNHRSLPVEFYDRWERQIATPYAELSEAEKQSDRDQVMRYWPLILSAFTRLQAESYEQAAKICENLRLTQGKRGTTSYTRKYVVEIRNRILTQAAEEIRKAKE